MQKAREEEGGYVRWKGGRESHSTQDRAKETFNFTAGDIMSSLENVLAAVQAAVVQHGEVWLQASLQEAHRQAGDSSAVPSSRTCSQRTRPPKHLSLEVTPRALWRYRSPSRDLLAAAAR